MTEAESAVIEAVGGARPGRGDRRVDRHRARAQALLAALLVAIYLTWWLTDAALHLPPMRYEQLPAGAVAHQQGAEYRLLSLREAPLLSDQYSEPKVAPPDAVWVVAQLSVTRRTVTTYFTCTLTLVGRDRQSWRPDDLAAVRPTPFCPPAELALNEPYEIEEVFVVPVSQRDQLVGIAVEQFDTGRDPVLTPPR